MLIVSNATPLIAFAKIQELPLMQKVVQEIIIPEEVRKELIVYGKDKIGSLEIAKATWIKSQTVSNPSNTQLLLPSLDKGEAEVIVLAQELNADLVLLDERSARGVAQLLGLKIMGSVGILIKAKQIGLIPKVQPHLDALMQQGIRYNLQFYNQVLTHLEEI